MNTATMVLLVVAVAGFSYAAYQGYQLHKAMGKLLK